MLGRALLAASLVALAACGAATAAGAPAVTFVLSGHGWGHGVGMSQWGARGYAQRGRSYDRILAHYYPKTRLGTVAAGRVRVVLASGKKTLALGSTGAWSVVDSTGVSVPLAPGKLVVGPDLAPAGSPLQPPLTFVPQGEPLTVAGKPYRGTIEVAPLAGGKSGAAGKLRAVDVVGIEDYLRGVVPAEMPSSWPAEALKAQAVAARSYALALRTDAKQPSELTADVRSQVYKGVSAETAATDAAVAATAGRVLLYGGKIADTLFSSSSGGRTSALSEAFPTAKPVPYLVSVDDPYDASPYRDWGPVTVTGAKLAKALALEGTVVEVAPALGPSGRVRTATLRLASGSTADVTGGDLRAKLGLRSTWLSIGVLSLQPPPAPTVLGGRGDPDGEGDRARRRPGARAARARRRLGPGAAVAAGPDGRFAIGLAPAQTTDFRLVAGTVRGGAVRVPVAPAVELLPALTGTVRPAVPGALVDIQLQQGLTWLTVASVPVDAAGAFTAAGLGPGVYRALYSPGAGLVRGTSAPVEAVS